MTKTKTLIGYRLLVIDEIRKTKNGNNFVFRYSFDCGGLVFAATTLNKLESSSSISLIKENPKNPLLLSVTYGLHAALMSMRLKERFHASPEAIMALLAKHRQQQRKNTVSLRSTKKAAHCG